MRTAGRGRFAAQPWPEGFAYREEVISPPEECALAERFALPLAPFAFCGFVGRRRVVSFAGRTLRPSDEIPAC